MLEEQDFTRLSDLDLNSIWHALDGGDLSQVNPTVLRSFMVECFCRDDQVLKTVGIEISAQFRDEEALQYLMELTLRDDNDETMDIFLIDELSERDVPDAYGTFRLFLAPGKPPKVRAFCAKVLFYDGFNCDVQDLARILNDERDSFVRVRIIGLLCSLTGRANWMNELNALASSTNLDTAREARAVRKHLILCND